LLASGLMKKKIKSLILALFYPNVRDRKD